MSNVPVISIDSAAVWYGPSGSENRTGIRATPEQLAKIAHGIGVALGRLGGAQEYVEVVKAKYIYDRSDNVLSKGQRSFSVYAVVQGPEKKQTSAVKVPVLEKEDIDGDLLARELHVAMANTMKSLVQSAMSDAEYWAKELQIPA